MRRILLLATTVALLAPTTALAGGWANVELSSLPRNAAPGVPWKVDITVLQHGVTPLAGVRPSVTIRGPGRREKVFAAQPTERPGVYRADVVFPTSGRWTYAVSDGFTDVPGRSYPPVQVGAGAVSPPPADGSDPAWLMLAGAAALAGLVLLALSRRRPRLAARPA